MKFKLLQFLTLLGITSLLLSSCIKDDVQELEDEGATFLKFSEPEIIHYFTPFTDVKKVDLFSLRRDANSKSSLSSPAKVTLTLNNDLIKAYNTANGTAYEVLPDSLFTLVNTAFKKSGNTYTVDFAPGDFAQDFTINLNGAKWDISHTYALGLTITDSANMNVNEGKKNVIAMLSVKNQWDGVYEVTGTLTDNAAPTITGNYPLVWDLVTAGPTKIVVYDNAQLGIPGHLILSSGSPSYYGSFGLELTIDPVTNKITNLVNWYGQPSANGRSAALDPSGENRYDPDTKTFYIKYFLLQPGTTVRTAFDEVWKFTGER